MARSLRGKFAIQVQAKILEPQGLQLEKEVGQKEAD